MKDSKKAIIEMFTEMSGAEQYQLLRELSMLSKPAKIVEYDQDEVISEHKCVRPLTLPVYVDPQDADTCVEYDATDKITAFTSCDTTSSFNRIDYMPAEISVDIKAYGVEGYVKEQGSYCWCFEEEREEEEKRIEAIREVGLTRASGYMYVWDAESAEDQLKRLK